MSNLIKAFEITQLHDTCITHWKKETISLNQHDFLALIEENHSFNFSLWMAEDKARRDDMGHAFVYQAKREIDGFNQQRNNRMEAMDTWLYQALKPSADITCPIHSETPGMMIDRLSILALKIYHMAIQKNRTDVSDTHHQSCEQKLQTLIAQRNQLAQCLQLFFDEICAKTRTFKVYHQFKMYNDPKLNPELYNHQTNTLETSERP
ncbi:MAG: DUF4254 domain-containing protein [Legionella sp.]|nr:DUF4254 domain-containing protein [Legionella sp.]